jgi:hypothetical protein
MSPEAALVLALEGLARDLARLDAQGDAGDTQQHEDEQVIPASCDARARQRDGPAPGGLGPSGPFLTAGRDGANARQLPG